LFIFLAVLIFNCAKKANTGDVDARDGLPRKVNLSDQYLSGAFEQSEPMNGTFVWIRAEHEGQLWAVIWRNPAVAGSCIQPFLLHVR